MSRAIESRAGGPYFGYIRCDRFKCPRANRVCEAEQLDQELLGRRYDGPRDRSWINRTPEHKAFLEARRPQHEIVWAQPLPLGWVSVEVRDQPSRHEFCGWRCARLWIAQQERSNVA